MKMQNSEKNRKGRKKKWILAAILLSLFIIFLASAAAVVMIDNRHVLFYITGAQETELEYGQEYTEPGVYAVSKGALFGEFKQHLPITTEIRGDFNKLGVCEIVYHTRSFFVDYSITRTVNVVDRTPPVIELTHNPDYHPSWFTGYEEEGFTARDNYDGDITDKVKRSVNDGCISYTVSDSSGNTATAVRELDFLDSTPQLTLYGGESITVPASQSFTDPGFSAVDMQGNDLSGYVYVSGEVIPYAPGTYELSYILESETGETISAVRTVTVLPANNPDIVTPDGRVIYLTFDDGPGPYTSALLDVLKKYNAKATFFVTGTYPKYYDMIGRAVREGHAVGVHTYSHNYRDIYSSEDAFFADFNAMQEIIYEQTGSYTSLYRFPGGSSNTVSRFNEGIISRLASALTDMGYTYYDWNVSSGDAGETTQTDTVAQNIIDGCSVRRVSIVLQHDIKDFSINAVETVLKWGLANGYTFLALDQTSPNAHHGIAN